MTHSTLTTATDPEWQIGGPGGGGATFYPTFLPTDSQRMAVRCDMTGIYLSADGGDSWRQHNLTSSANAFAFERDHRRSSTSAPPVSFARTTLATAGSSCCRRRRRRSASVTSATMPTFNLLEPGSLYPAGNASVAAILIHPEDRISSSQ